MLVCSWSLDHRSTGVRDQPFPYLIHLLISTLRRPFINAETTGGGIPGWVIRKHGDMRTNSTDYFESSFQRLLRKVSSRLTLAAF